MTAPRDVLIEAGQLAAERRPYAFATVVRVERPTSAREGNHALIKPDGEVVGWIGGACSEPTVIREALRAIGDGKPRLVAIEGSCASEGLVEVFIEPQLPEPVLTIVGDGPAASTLADLAARIGWRVERQVVPHAEAVVVATLGPGDETALHEALATPRRLHRARREPPARRCNAGRDAPERRRRGSPCPGSGAGRPRPRPVDPGGDRGCDPGRARRVAACALRNRRPEAETARLPRRPQPAGRSVDPVCGMAVSAETAIESAEVDGVRYYFCCAGCRRRFESDPDRYTEVNVK